MGFLDLLSLYLFDMLLAIGGGPLKHDLFQCPFMTHFGFCFFGLDLGLLSLFLIFPLVGCLFNEIC
jgi:hypothetical protein